MKRGALTCYALEGAYPPSYAYIKKYYGIAVDEKKYIIHYNIFAANIMPDIAVIARGGGGS